MGECSAPARAGPDRAVRLHADVAHDRPDRRGAAAACHDSKPAESLRLRIRVNAPWSVYMKAARSAAIRAHATQWLAGKTSLGGADYFEYTHIALFERTFPGKENPFSAAQMQFVQLLFLVQATFLIYLPVSIRERLLALLPAAACPALLVMSSSSHPSVTMASSPSFSRSAAYAMSTLVCESLAHGTFVSSVMHLVSSSKPSVSKSCCTSSRRSAPCGAGAAGGRHRPCEPGRRHPDG